MAAQHLSVAALCVTLHYKKGVMRVSSSPLGDLLLAACSSRRVPTIAAILDILDI